MINKNIWLIGTGYMAIEYAKVLNALNCDYKVIGRGEKNAKTFFEQTGVQPFIGGLETFLKTNPEIPEAVINAVGIEILSNTTVMLLNYEVKYILLEKPGFGYPDELENTVKIAKEKNAKINIAYNRRYYQSVIKAKQIIEADGGVINFHFEFTEWAHTIGTLVKDKAEHENWFYGNSTHLIDLAFYLGGNPKIINAYKKGSLSWHPSGSIYAGAGETNTGALFSYTANWESPGRWNLELCTKNFRLIFKPIEKLQIMKIGSVAIDFVEDIDYKIDENYKPGIFLQTESFLENKEQITIMDLIENLSSIFNKINF